jgi:hypothetical protein
MTCSLKDTHTGTGYKILIAYSDYATGETLTATETATCPAGASVGNSYGFPPSQFRVSLCYVDPASTHTTFTVTVNGLTGSGARTEELLVTEMYGYASGHSVANGVNNSNSFTFTTTGSNQYIEAVGADYNQHSNAGSGFSQRSYMGTSAGATKSRIIEEYQSAPTAGTYTTSFVTTGAFPTTRIVAISFDLAGTNPPPSVLIKQTCMAGNGGGGDLNCDLSGLSSGNKLIFAGSSDTNSGIVAGCTGETCICPGSSNITHTYGGGTLTTGLCYADLASNHSTYSTGMSVGSPFATALISVMEISGLNSGIDSGSETTAAAQSVSYTTGSANEYTIFSGVDVTGTIIAPASGFVQAAQPSNPTRWTWQNLVGVKNTISAGSNTASFTSANTKPLIATFSFGIPAPPTASGYPMIF